MIQTLALTKIVLDLVMLPIGLLNPNKGRLTGHEPNVNVERIAPVNRKIHSQEIHGVKISYK